MSAAKIQPVEDLLAKDPESGMDVEVHPQGGVHDKEVQVPNTRAAAYTPAGYPVCYTLPPTVAW